MTNRTAFLDTIAYSEGTDNGRQRTHDRGYDVLVGGGLFDDYTDHPRILVDLPKLGIKSTAAGRYQILAKNYDFYKKQLGLHDFSPASQDAIAIQLIRESRALMDVDIGNFDIAIRKCNHIWASLPGAGYGQHENHMELLSEVYVKAGGKIGSA